MNRIFWIDLEMTGLEVDREVIIEAAAIVTDLDWTELEEYHAVIKQPQEYLDRMDKWNTKHHGQSGLTAAVPNGRDPMAVEEELLKMIDQHWPSSERPILAGNSISQDRLFIRKYWPALEKRLHYRMLDVSSWKIIMKEKYERPYDKKQNHRALDDIRESIEELKFYCQFLEFDS